MASKNELASHPSHPLLNRLVRSFRSTKSTILTNYPVASGTNGLDNLAALGIQDSANTTYQYSAATASMPHTYCLTATTGTTSYKIQSSNTTPTPGGCPGHGVGGVSAVTNIAVNPRATTYSPGSGQFGWTTSRWAGTSPAAASYSLVTGASDGPLGITTYARKTWTTAPAAMSNSGDSGFANSSGHFTVAQDDSYTVSCYVRPSVNRNFNIAVYQYTSSGAAFSTPRVNGPSVSGPANQWTRVSNTYMVPAGVGEITLVCDSTSSAGNGAVNWSVGSTLDGTGLMVTQGSTLYGYADGNSTDWVWNGTPNSSSSSGPAL